MQTSVITLTNEELELKECSYSDYHNINIYSKVPIVFAGQRGNTRPAALSERELWFVTNKTPQ